MKISKTLRHSVSAMLLLLYGGTATAQISVTANFSKWVEYPLVKKIGVYQTPLTCEKWILRDVPKMSQIEARSFRYEFAWGKDLYGSDAISGTKANPVVNLSKADLLFDKAYENTQAFVFAHGYMPANMQSAPGGLGWQSPPSDNNAWKTVNQLAAAHWREKGYSNRYVEVWNEPDLPGGFFSGTMEDYLRVYHYAAQGAKAGDADCKVGGPAIAYMTWWHDALVDYAKQNNLPVDFLSGHAYGADFLWELNAMRNALNNFNNKSAEMLLTEYSPYPAAEYAANGPVERAEAAMTFFEAVQTMMEYPDLTYVTWAQYIDPEAGNSEQAFSDWDKLGLVDGNNGSRKALFNAFRVFGMMPVNRYQIATSTLKGMASGDESHVATVLWNNTDKGKKTRLTMNHIPFDEGIVETYHIDKKHNSWYENAYDELIPTSVSHVTFPNGTYSVVDSVRDQGVFFVRISALDAKPSFMRNDFAKMVKTQQWFTSRTNTAPYAQFDSKTWTAYLSTNGESNGWALAGVTAEDVPETFKVKSINSGNLKNTNANAALCLRMDFEQTNGEYAKSVVFHGGIYHPDRSNVLPWGTKRKPDAEVEVADFNNFDVDIRPYLPENFSGRVLFSFDMSSTGANAKANIQLLADSAPRISTVQVDSISNTTVKLSFSLDGAPEQIDKAGFVLGVEKDPLSLASPKSYVAERQGDRFVAVISKLSSMKNYHVRGFVDGRYTPENVFFTATKAAISTTNLKVDTENLTASFTGNISADNGSPVVERGFVWSETEKNSEPTQHDNFVRMGSGTGTFKYTLERLKPETDYVMRSYAINRGGIAYSKTRTFTTKSADAIEAVSDDVPTAKGLLYDIMGRRLPNKETSLRHGLYVRDGKVFVK